MADQRYGGGAATRGATDQPQPTGAHSDIAFPADDRPVTDVQVAIVVTQLEWQMGELRWRLRSGRVTGHEREEFADVFEQTAKLLRHSAPVVVIEADR